MNRSAEDAYRAAAGQYAELHRFLAEEQRELDQGKWRASQSRMEIYPLDGGGTERYLPGATGENSYIFEATRKSGSEGDPLTQLSRTAERWTSRGWAVRKVTSSYSGSTRIIAVTDQDYWIAADEESDGLYLTAHTPPYWGAYMELADDVHERYEAEKAQGEHARFDIDEDEQMLLLPGDYRPFPRWDAVD